MFYCLSLHKNITKHMFVNCKFVDEHRWADNNFTSCWHSWIWKCTFWSLLCLGTIKLCNGLWMQLVKKKKKKMSTISSKVYFNTFSPKAFKCTKKSSLSPETIQYWSIAVNYCNSLFSSLSDQCRKGCLQNHSLRVWLYHWHVGVQSVHKLSLLFRTRNTK